MHDRVLNPFNMCAIDLENFMVDGVEISFGDVRSVELTQQGEAILTLKDDLADEYGTIYTVATGVLSAKAFAMGNGGLGYLLFIMEDGTVDHVVIARTRIHIELQERVADVENVTDLFQGNTHYDIYARDIYDKEYSLSQSLLDFENIVNYQ